MMKLHLGCGKRFLPGFMHVDVNPLSHIDYVIDISDLSIFKDESVAEIYASHVLEHFPRTKILDILIEWHRVLKPNGILRLAVPDFGSVVNRYSQTGSLGELVGLLYGGQRDKYDYHYMTFDFNLLEEFLHTAGFSNVCRYDWQDFLPKDYDDISKAYLPHYDTGGMLMSLNVIAAKTTIPKEPSERLKYVMGTLRLH